MELDSAQRQNIWATEQRNERAHGPCLVCDSLPKRDKNELFLKRMKMGDEKWVVNNNVERKRSRSLSNGSFGELFVQLLIDSDEEADSEDVSGAPDGLLADDEDSEGESEAGWSSTIVQPSLVPFTEENGIQNYDVYAFSNPMSLYKLFMADESVKVVIEESNRCGSAKYSTWSVLEE
uniref:Uncharacterized protein n=1 Tax=Haemonchus contortus TaxID=6289 RepID=A0A7I4Y473_HAECO